jgi:hypothetical protein
MNCGCASGCVELMEIKWKVLITLLKAALPTQLSLGYNTL